MDHVTHPPCSGGARPPDRGRAQPVAAIRLNGEAQTLLQGLWPVGHAPSPARHAAVPGPQLVRGAIATFDSRSVMRFLGHRLYENHEGEIVSDYRVVRKECA